MILSLWESYHSLPPEKNNANLHQIMQITLRLQYAPALAAVTAGMVHADHFSESEVARPIEAGTAQDGSLPPGNCNCRNMVAANPFMSSS